jgi:nondiscriminating glutamyl-tRNA synthetase
LFNWLYARKNKGAFILRLEDMDLSRSVRSYETMLLDGLRWLGMDWDEGPDVGGPCGPYRQSERAEPYQEYLKVLTDAGLAYPCYCSEDELETERQQMLDKGIAPHYRGKCRYLTKARLRQMEADRRKPAIRFRVDKGAIRVDDTICGPVSFDANLIGDFVIVRANGIPAYDFAVVIDDALMDISLVIRDEDHLSNTPRQILLCEALSFEPPQFAHHASLLGTDKTKLSKRHSETAIGILRTQGFVPEAVTNYLAWVGGGIGAGQEILSRDETIESFEVTRAGKNASTFDMAKLRWMNAAHLRRLPATMVLDYWHDMGVGRVIRERNRLLEVIPGVIDCVETLDQLEPLLEIFAEKHVAFSMEAEDYLRGHRGRNVLKELASALEQTTAPRSREASWAVIKQVETASGQSGKELFMPIRAALTGETAGPEVETILRNLDKTTMLHRIERALDFAVE